jgi:predicted HNH restriction endonuclease
METRRVRQKFRNGRRWEFREFDIPTDEEIGRLAERLHTARQAHSELLDDWHVSYTPSRSFDYRRESYDPLDPASREVSQVHSAIPSHFEIRYGSWLTPYWRIRLTWNKGDDQPPDWLRQEPDVTALPAATQQSLFADVMNVSQERPSPSPPFLEGTAYQIEATEYERNPEARRLCILHYGARCFICGFDFGKAYGLVAEGFIHVHHLTPVSTVGEQYAVDPIADLRPLCPNCHAVAHLRTPPYSIEDIKRFLQSTLR